MSEGKTEMFFFFDFVWPKLSDEGKLLVVMAMVEKYWLFKMAGGTGCGRT